MHAWWLRAISSVTPSRTVRDMYLPGVFISNFAPAFRYCTYGKEQLAPCDA
jgi:hypothetical protein